jgi:hypothetical protein
MDTSSSDARYWINDRLFAFTGVGALSAASLWWIITDNIPLLAVAAGSLIICLVALQYTSRTFFQWVNCALVSHVVLGIGLAGYSMRFFDDVMHFVLVSWMTILALNELDLRIKWNGAKLSPLYLGVVGLVFSLAVGTLWEFFEFSVDQTGVYQSQVGLTDTMMDLLADGAGGVVAAIVSILGRNRGSVRFAVTALNPRHLKGY